MALGDCSLGFSLEQQECFVSTNYSQNGDLRGRPGMGYAATVALVSRAETAGEIAERSIANLAALAPRLVPTTDSRCTFLTISCLLLRCYLHRLHCLRQCVYFEVV